MQYIYNINISSIIHVRSTFRHVSANPLHKPLISNRLKAEAARKCIWNCQSRVLAFVAYLLVRKHYGVGSEEQLNVGNFFAAFIATARTSLTVKGLYLNVFPLFVLLVPIFVLLLGRRNTDSSKPVIACLLALTGLLFASMTSNVVYNVGRLVMYTAPVVAVFVAVLFDTDAKARLGA